MTEPSPEAEPDTEPNSGPAVEPAPEDQVDAEPEPLDDPAPERLVRRLFAALVLTAFALGFLLTMAPQFSITAGETLRIGIIGPMSGPDASKGEAMVAGASLLVERANATGQLGDKRVELVIRDDRNDPEVAREEAAKLAVETDVLAVLGHLTDATSRVAAPIYETQKLPAVTGSSGLISLTAANKWYFRVGLTTTSQGTFAANYMARVLNEEELILIHEENAYGKSLAVAIEDELSFLKRLGITAMVVKKKLGFDSSSDDAEKTIEKIVKDLSENYAKEMIFVAVDEKTAPELIRRIQDNPRMRFGNPIPFKIMGPESLASPTLVAAFSKLRREKFRPGVYSEGIHAVAPFLEDVANQKALDFRSLYRERHGETPNVIAAGFHDAAAIVVEALSRLDDASGELSAMREEVQSQLAALDSADKAISGVTGNLRFDRAGNAVKPVPIGVYHAGRLVSPPLQLSSIASIDTTSSQDVLQIHGDYYTRTNIVHAGLQVNQISDIDLGARRFKADFNLWFRYHSKQDMSAIEFPNAAEDIKLGKPIESSDEGGTYYRLHRIQGLFKMDFATAAEPSRSRLLGIQVRHRDLNFERLILVPDVLGMKSGDAGSLKERIDRTLIFGDLTDWVIDKAQTFLDTEPIATRGNPRFGGKEVEGYSRLNLGVWIKPTDVTLRGLIDTDFALKLFLLLGIAISLVANISDRPWFQPFVNLFWFPQVAAFLVMLFCAEAIVVDWLERQYMSSGHIQLVITSFRILWWLAPAWILNHGIERFFWRPLEVRTGRDVPRLVRVFVAGLVFTLALLGVVAFVFDQKITSLLATSGVLAMIIGLAVQMNLSNIFSGIAINMERPFRMGDWIRVSGFEPGKVVGITWRTTRLETFDNNIVCIPNSVASDSTVENLSYPEETFRSDLMVHIDPGARPQWVEKILFDAVISAEGVLKDPHPIILFQGVKQWSAEYSVRYFCKDYRESIDIDAAVWRDIVQNLRYAGFKSVVHAEFTLFHLVHDEEDRPDVAPLLINDVPIFDPFGPEEKQRLCDMLKRTSLEPERTVIKQGDTGDSLFIVAEGALMVEITMDDGETTLEVARLGAGDFFGEMALLTGEPRGATVTTITPSLLFEISKADIELVMRQFPNIADDLSKILTRRTLENLRRKNAHYASLTEEKSLAQNILDKIGRFFDLSFGTAANDSVKN